MKKADYVVYSSTGLLPEHSDIVIKHKLKDITVEELNALIRHLKPWSKAKNELGLTVGYLRKDGSESKKTKVRCDCCQWTS